MRRAYLAASGLVAIAIAWSKPIKPQLDFDIDAGYARQILDGLNPYDLAVVPRPPSAWLLQLPLAWIDTALLSRIAGAAAFLAIGWLAHRISRLDLMWQPLFVAAAGLPLGATNVIESGNMASIVAVLFVVAWAKRSGVAVGVAAALRLYPMVFLFAVRRRSAIWTVLALTVAGLVLVPDLGIDGITGNAGIFGDHSGNGSAVRFIGLPAATLIGGALAWRATRVGFDQAMSLTACAAVLVPSISWPGYHLILIPVVVWAVTRGRWWALAAVPFWFAGYGLDLGTAHFVAALIVVSAVWATPTGRTRTPAHSQTTRQTAPRLHPNETKPVRSGSAST